MIIFISCGAKKRTEPCVAAEMYTGYFFQTCLAYARSLSPRKIYILSAQYGVLELTDKIKPYNKNLNSAGRQQQKNWAYKCYKQLLQLNIDFNEETIFIGGKVYWRYLATLFPNRKIPFAHLKNGIQAKIMNRELKNVHGNKKT